MSVFITFEGVDGAGKSTQLELLLEYMRQKGVDFIFTREPGGTAIAEKIRNLVLDPANTGMSVITEAFLYAASRAEHVNNVIRPALTAHKVVICDRFVDSSMAYQAYAGGLPPEFVAQINEMATGSLKPHRTIVFDLDPAIAKQRTAANAQDRIEQKSAWYHQQVRQAYLDLAREEPRRVKLVDASGSIDAVQAEVRRLVDEILPRRPAGT